MGIIKTGMLLTIFIIFKEKYFMHPYNEIILEKSPLNIKIAFYTKSGGYLPLHWHKELEILYPLNGESDVFINGTAYHQENQQLLVIDSGNIHSTLNYGNSAMFLCIHVSKESLLWYFPGIENYNICCYPGMVSDKDFPVYFEMCRFLKRITELYITNQPVFLLESEGLVLQLISRLLTNFASKKITLADNNNRIIINRVQSITNYVEKHFKEQITLQDIANMLGIGKEHFCRFFKKNMGISFLQYLNEVRAVHVYQDLNHTDLPVQIIMEKNGFTNQKLFNKVFKNLYGCTPSQARNGSYIFKKT